jgi:hypothetical protein
MTPTVLIVLLVAALAVAAIYGRRRGSREAHARRHLGVVSTRWLSELRRDEPWIGR